MAPHLHVIALVSGGKDSLFSLLHCQANGHTLVALANVHPAPSPANETREQDVDSYMYQTVGHAVIPLYQHALGIPLYRQQITGTAVNSSRDYEKRGLQEQDETEDLVPLLREVMRAHPEANAVSTGAILSTYQRTRVESVASRLGLTPLSYLWQYPLLPPYTQSSLLVDMAAVGQEAVIVKTASGGLDESFLGLDVANQRTVAKLGKAMARFGEATNGALVGEGGEFETLALDGPRCLWKRRIRLEETVPEVLDGGQTVLRIRASSVEEKSGDAKEDLSALRIPELFDEEFEKILSVTNNDKPLSTNNTPQNAPQSSHDVSIFENLPRNTCHDTATVFTAFNLTTKNPPSEMNCPSLQLTEILVHLDAYLQQRHLLISNINHCTLLLRNMSSFTALNPIYGTFFANINPPARVTVAVGDAMPSDIDVILSIILDKDSTPHQTGQDTHKSTINRQGLHVQSRSYWAPANIGPYSQAISVTLPSQTPDEQTKDLAGEVVYIAGQIPLIPASMEVYTDRGFTGQAALSLQHLWRIGRAKNVRCWTASIAYLSSTQDATEGVRIAQDLWRKMHSNPTSHPSSDNESDNEDPWDRLNTHTQTFTNNTFRAAIPDHNAISGGIPPCYIVQIASLPRDVDIEWSATGLTHTSLNITTPSPNNETIISPTHSGTKFIARTITCLSDMRSHAWSYATLYASPKLDVDGRNAPAGVAWIPCVRVWDGHGKEVGGVLVGRVDV